MKIKLSFLILLFIIPFGCKEEKQIKIIPADEMYYTFNQLNTPPKFISNDSTKVNTEFVNLSTMVNDFYKKLPENERKDFQLSYQFLVNKNGQIDKIQIVKSNFPQIDKKIAEAIKDWKFQPAIKDGKKVNFIFPWSINLNNENSEYFVAVEEMPELLGGLKGLQSKIKYPEAAKREGIEGKVYVLAFIDEKGNVANAKVIKGAGYGLDEAALDAVKQTKFTPGKQRGKPVKVQVTIPIVFKLK